MLAAKLPDPLLAAWHCRGLEAFARCIAAFPNLMPLILQKVSYPPFMHSLQPKMCTVITVGLEVKKCLPHWAP